MRGFAATSARGRTGRTTEAQATVGEITLQGTLAFLVFGALPFAFASAALYLLVEPWLPRGRWPVRCSALLDLIPSRRSSTR